MIKWIRWSLLMILGMKSAGGTLRANQDHVCLKTEEYKTMIWVDQIVPLITTEKSWCWDPAKGFRCTKVKVKNQSKKTPKEIIRTRLVLKCCDGYAEIDSECISKCSTECLHRGCTDVDPCECGYHGPPCHEPCPSGKWGVNCLEKCDCINSNGCDPVDGRCSCLSGWQGRRCESPCPPGHYGMNCQSKCICHNSACHHATGACLDPVTEIILNKLKAPDSLSEPDIKEVSAQIPATEMSSTSMTKATTIPLIIKTEDLEMSQTSMETSTVILVLPSDSSTNADSTVGENPTENFINERGEEFSTTDLIGDEETTRYDHVSWETTRSTEEETFITDNGEIYSSSHKLGTPEIETIGEKKNYIIGPTIREPSLTTVETTFTGGTQSATKTNFGHTEINSYNNVTDNGNEVVNATTTTNSDGSKSVDNNYNIINISWTGESSSIASTDIQPVKGETSTKPPEKGTEETFRHFNTFRFIPSLSVLTGITILILIIGARWLALQHKRKNKKILARKKQDIFKSKERQKFRESLFIEKSFLDASVCLYEMNSKEERPTLQTFKPLPGS